MGQKGLHTWDINIHYHRCPQCGGIIESRQDYRYLLGSYQKHVLCDRCGHQFIIVKNAKPAIGPLIGDPEPVEIEWGDPR